MDAAINQPGHHPHQARVFLALMPINLPQDLEAVHGSGRQAHCPRPLQAAPPGAQQFGF